MRAEYPPTVSESMSEATQDASIAAGLYVATSILQQGLDFVRTSLTEESQLTYQSKLHPGGTIGMRSSDPRTLA